MTNYSTIPLWDSIISQFPENNRIGGILTPEEQLWDYRDYRIHLDWYHQPRAAVKVILLHGVGGNGRLLSFIGVPLHRAGFEVIAPDLPGYGLSRVECPIWDYNSWIEVVDGLVTRERQRDPRPVVLFGLSAGGMLAYHVACRNRGVAGLVATNLLDQRIPAVREQSAVNRQMARFGLPALRLLTRVLPGLRLPMRALANMHAISADDTLVRLLLSDRTSAGVRVAIRFVLSMIDAQPDIEPEEFRLCPVLLVHPACDRWTPVDISRLFFDRLNCEKNIFLLDNAGHFPIESPGINQLEAKVIEFLHRIQA